MKSRIRLFLTSIALVLLTGCENETCFSCDEEIDSWAKENIKELRLKSRTEISKFNLEKQRAAFRTFTPIKRREIWLDKLASMKRIFSSQDELRHFSKIEKFIEGLDFSQEISDSQADYFFNWFNEGVENYGWTNYFLASGFMRLGETVNSEDQYKNLYTFEPRMQNKQDSFGLMQLLIINDANAEEIDCNCRWDTHCQLIASSDCNTQSACEETVLGCGIVFMQSCTGRCGY